MDNSRNPSCDTIIQRRWCRFQSKTFRPEVGVKIFGFKLPNDRAAILEPLSIIHWQKLGYMDWIRVQRSSFMSTTFWQFMIFIVRSW